MKYKFRKRDWVKIINEGETYSTYNTMAKKLKAKYWQSDENFSLRTDYNNTIGIIKNIGLHEKTFINIYLVYLPKYKKEILIGEDGIVEVSFQDICKLIRKKYANKRRTQKKNLRVAC